MAITRIQTKRGLWSSGTSFTVTLDSVPVNGNVLILTFASLNTIATPVTVSSISETGVTWSKTTSITDGVDSDTEIWAGAVGGGASQSITVNITTITGGGGAVANVCEYSGLANMTTDKTATNSGPYSSTGTTATTTQDSELWVGSIEASNSSSAPAGQTAPTNGFTLLDGVEINPSVNFYFSNAYLEKISSATGIAESGTTTPSLCIGCIATFKGMLVSTPGGVRFGGFALPRAQVADWASTHSYIERPIPGRVTGYRKDLSNQGRTETVEGIFQATSQPEVAAFIERIRRWVDGVARIVDLGDGLTPFYALMTDPSFSTTAGDWASGKYRLNYSVTFVEDEAPT